jgi:general secretion pathway protein J
MALANNDPADAINEICNRSFSSECQCHWSKRTPCPSQLDPFEPPMSAHRAGFTLLELMIAMALLGVLTVGVSGSLRFGVRAWETVDRTIDLSEDALTKQAYLRRQIEGARAHSIAGKGAEESDSASAFVGKVNEMRFVAALPAQANSPGLNQIWLAIKPSAEGQALVLRWRRIGKANELAEKIILDGIKDAHFAYFGSTDVKESPRWGETWSHGDELPRLVSIEIQLNDPTVAWPPLVVAPASSPDFSSAS